MANDFKVRSLEYLHLRIRTLGYPENGESIMISLMDDDKELFNVFIDNYEVGNYQYWISLLPPETKIHAFIWTHPDEDHSLGVHKLLSKFDSNREARIFLPTSLTRNLLELNNKTAALPCYDYLKENYNKNRTYLWNEVSLCQDEGIRNLCQRKIVDRSNNNSVTFRIGFMLPIGAMVNRRVDKSQMNSGEMNHLSLFTVVELNRFRYIFAGDLSKINVQFLDDDYLNNCRFIKIPHHGSKDPIKLVDKIECIPSLKMHSVTTIFGTTNPFKVVLDKYAEKCEEVFSTDRGEAQFGMVEIDYYVNDLDRINIKLEGNAKLVRQNSKYIPTVASTPDSA